MKNRGEFYNLDKKVNSFVKNLNKEYKNIFYMKQIKKVAPWNKTKRERVYYYTIYNLIDDSNVEWAVLILKGTFDEVKECILNTVDNFLIQNNLKH